MIPQITYVSFFPLVLPLFLGGHIMWITCCWRYHKHYHKSLFFSPPFSGYMLLMFTATHSFQHSSYFTVMLSFYFVFNKILTFILNIICSYLSIFSLTTSSSHSNSLLLVSYFGRTWFLSRSAIKFAFHGRNLLLPLSELPRIRWYVKHCTYKCTH